MLAAPVLASPQDWSGSFLSPVRNVLNKKNLDRFLDFDEAVRRLGTIARDAKMSPEDRKLAAELVCSS